MFILQSELYEAEYTCAGLFRKESKLVVGSTRGSLVFYKWGEFGLHTDELPCRQKKAINCLIPVSENIAVTGWEDGQIRYFPFLNFNCLIKKPIFGVDY